MSTLPSVLNEEVELFKLFFDDIDLSDDQIKEIIDASEKTKTSAKEVFNEQKMSSIHDDLDREIINVLEEAVTSEPLQTGKEKLSRVMKRLHCLTSGVSKGALITQTIAELIDDKHRYGTIGHPLYQAWSSSTSSLSYNEWLEALEQGDNVEGRELIPDTFRKSKKRKPYFVDGKLNPEIPTVDYLNENERKGYLLKIKEGRFETAHAGVISSEEHDFTTFIFVMAPDKKIYVGEYDRGSFNHTSFLAGSAVLSAGEMFFDNGKLDVITNKSGHYHTDDKAMLKILAELHAQGVDLSDVTYRRVKNKYDVQEFNALEFLITRTQVR